MSVKIRRVQQEDLAQIAEIEQENFTDPWTMQGFLDAYQMEQVLFLVASCEDVIAGYVVLYCAGDEGEIPTISVKKEFRRKEIASLLLKELFYQARKKTVQQIYLEVRESNECAQHLYEKNGFIQVGKRKNFYQHPTEDALVMQAHLK